MKVCRRCEKEKDRSQFSHDCTRPDGLSYWCRQCHKDNKKRTWKNRTAGSLKVRYGLTLEDYDRMLEDQDGKCAICGDIEPSGRRLAVDHDHHTGNIRGLLCLRCNTRLGFWEAYRNKIRSYLGE